MDYNKEEQKPQEEKVKEEYVDLKLNIDKDSFLNKIFPKTYCPHCKKRIIENPLFVVDENTGEYKKPLVRDKTKNKGWFRVPWYVIIIVMLVIISAWVYSHDTKICREFQENPCKWMINNANYCYRFDSEGYENPFPSNPNMTIEEITGNLK